MCKFFIKKFLIQDFQTNLCYEFEKSKSMDKTVQKKCYKILEAILSSGKQQQQQPNASISKFINGKFQAIAGSLVKSLASCNAAAKVPRLKCILDLMDYVAEAAPHKQFLRQILPEVILCMREVNHKSREAALELLNSMLRLWQKLGLTLSPPVSETDSLNEFIHLVMIGIAGSTNMASCACLALSSLTYEFRGMCMS
jgi:ribosomal RNA-processing protein 12